VVNVFDVLATHFIKNTTSLWSCEVLGSRREAGYNDDKCADTDSCRCIVIVLLLTGLTDGKLNTIMQEAR
jgi:hypothetical protein